MGRSTLPLGPISTMTRHVSSPSNIGPVGLLGFEARDWIGLFNLFLMLFAFACFFPYPAIPIGNRNGLQAGEAMALMALPLELFRPPTRALGIYVLYLIPISLSALIALVSGSDGAPDILVKEMLSTLIAVTIITLSPRLVGGDLPRKVVHLAAAAILIHVGIGIIQIYAFSKNQFPLLFLYKNPSFKPMETWAEIYATYMKRPCGLFPEPSALSASTAPWLLLICGVLFNAEARRRLAPSSLSCWFLGISLVAGVVLIVLSRSGLAPAILAGVMAVVVAHWKRSGLQGNALASALVVFVALVACFGLAFVAWRIQAGFEDRFESSWGLRSKSIATALTANTEPLPFLFGVGPGQASVIVENMLAGMELPDGEAQMTVWSVSVAYYMDTGLMGAIALAGIVGLSLRAIARSSAKFLGIVAMGVWWVGITVITSYTHLSAIWLFLGFLVEWERIFPPLTKSKPEVSTISQPSISERFSVTQAV